MSTSYIYQIINTVNLHYYIGSSCSKKRWKQHKDLLIVNKHKNIHLQRAWNKYNESNFIFQIIEFWDGDLLDREQEYLDICVGQKDCYNIAKNAYAPMAGRKHSDECKERMSKNRIGKKISEETKQKLRKTNSGKYHPMWGHPRSIEVRNKISETLIGKMTKEKNPFYNKKHSIKSKIKNAMARSLLTINQVKYIKLQLLNHTKPCDLARELNISYKSILDIKSGRTWSYIND